MSQSSTMHGQKVNSGTPWTVRILTCFAHILQIVAPILTCYQSTNSNRCELCNGTSVKAKLNSNQKVKFWIFSVNDGQTRSTSVNVKNFSACFGTGCYRWAFFNHTRVNSKFHTNKKSNLGILGQSEPLLVLPVTSKR